jgi:four helix bundle protein
MALDHHKLEVYRRSLTLLEVCDEVVTQLPPGRAHLRDQMDRAASSIVANIAEGAGEFSRKEKARFYRMARGSAIEMAAWLEIVARRHEAPEPLVKRALQQLQDVVSMLVKLIHRCER